MPTKRIAVISDTHGRVPDRLLDRLEGAAEIWHLGDVTEPDVLLPLQMLKPKLSVVGGNCDPYGLWPQKLELERHGFTFLLQHLPPSEANAGLDAVLFGHLHRPIDEIWNSARILNPGAITGPRNGSYASFAWIGFAADGWSWEVETL